MRTRILHDLILSKASYANGVFYPSATQFGGMNFALPPHIAKNVLEIHYLASMFIKEKFDFGFYDEYKIRDCVNIGDDGSLSWENSQEQRYWTLVKGNRNPNPSP